MPGPLDGDRIADLSAVRRGGMGALFDTPNRDKRSIALNLGEEEIEETRAKGVVS